MKPTFARGFARGLQNVTGKDRGEQNEKRVSELVKVLLEESELSKEDIEALVREVYRYFQSNSGAFYMAARLKSAIEAEKERCCKEKAASIIRTALVTVAEQMCENLRMATQLGKQARFSVEIALWVALEIDSKEGLVSAKLMRACGKGLSGTEIDDFFWEQKGKAAQEHGRLDWLLTVFSEGMLSAEKPVEILSIHLLRNNRGPSF